MLTCCSIGESTVFYGRRSVLPGITKPYFIGAFARDLDADSEALTAGDTRIARLQIQSCF